MSTQPVPAFPQTRHSLIALLQAAQADGEPAGEARRSAFDAVCRAYRLPLCRYLERRWRMQQADAEDLTQGFLAQAWDQGFLARFDPAQARFRTFMRVCLDRHVQNSWRHAAARSRAGHAVHVDIDHLGDIADPETPDTAIETAFREEFIRVLYTRAVERLARELAARGRSVVFEVFRRYDLESDASPRYAAIAEALGIAVTQVTNHLHVARRRFRELLIDELREMCSSDAEFRDEARDLLGIRLG